MVNNLSKSMKLDESSNHGLSKHFTTAGTVPLFLPIHCKERSLNGEMTIIHWMETSFFFLICSRDKFLWDWEEVLNNKLALEQNILAFSKYGCDNGVWSLNVQFSREDDDEPVDGMRSSLNMGVVSSHLQLLDGCVFFCVVPSGNQMWEWKIPYKYWVHVVTRADDKILCQIVVCLWGKAHMGSAYDFNLLMYFLVLRIGTRCLPVISLCVYALYSQRWKSWQLYTFPGFRLADKF